MTDISLNDSYVYVITALLPLAAGMLIFQANPYHALILRGILGAIAALVYAVLGAADVALTEALVGTMLAITLYAVAVRSSLVMRLGVLQDRELDKELDKDTSRNTSRNTSRDIEAAEAGSAPRKHHFEQLMTDFRKVLENHHLRLELVPYADPQALQQALINQEIHATCARSGPGEQMPYPYHTTTRIRRLYDLMQTELVSAPTSLAYLDVPTPKTADLKLSNPKRPNLKATDAGEKHS